ncbi:MAG TPA: hypothetical protein VE972_14915 [Conexibacter sp.]|nr:hypothetical protein [Conexibacter sp.]
MQGLADTRVRVLVARPHLSAALLIALFVLIYLWPVLIGGDILSPNAFLWNLVPWRSAHPPGVAQYTNGLLTDIPLADYPWRFFAREMLQQGTFPAWNPHVFAGAPFYSNPQTGLFSIFSLPLWILPLNYAIGLAAGLKLWTGGFGTYLLVRQLRLGFLPGLLAGIAFAFSAINITWLTHETLPAVAVLLPWIVLLVERIFERGGLGSAVGLALVTAIGLGGGHPGMQVHLIAAAGLYALLRFALLREGPLAQRARTLGLVLGGLGTGVLLMGAMLVPEVLSSHGTLGTAARQGGGGGSLPGAHMPFTAIRSVLFPGWWGRPGGAELSERLLEATGLEDANYNERTFYAGAVALILAGGGLVTRGAWRRKAPFAVLGVLGLAIPLHTPGLYDLVIHLPAFDLVQNQRMHFVFAFAVAVLAAFGLQAVLERARDEPRRMAVAIGAVVVGLGAIATVHTRAGDMGRFVQHVFTGSDSSSPGVLSLTAIAWFLLFAGGVLCALIAARRRPEWTTALAVGLVALAALDAYHFAVGYQPMGPASKVIPPRTPAIAYLQRHADAGRFVGFEYELPTEWSLIYGLDDVRGYDPPQPTLRYYRLWLTAEPEQTNWQPFKIDGLSPQAAKVVSVLGARYVLAGPGVATLPLGDRALQPLQRVYAGSDATIFVNPNAVPRALVAPRVRLTADEDATRAALVGDGFDPRRTVVVERDQPGVAALAGTGAGGRVAVASEANSSVTLNATLTRRGLVVLNDDFTDGWTVRVDGDTAPALHVNDVMRGVVVGPGQHRIVWIYRVPGLRAGLLLSLLGLALLGGGAAVLAVRARRQRS